MTSSFPRFYFTSNLISHKNGIAKILANPNEIKCDWCDPDNQPDDAISYCLTCKEFCCAECQQSHSRAKATRDHNCVSVEDGWKLVSEHPFSSPENIIAQFRAEIEPKLIEVYLFFFSSCYWFDHHSTVLKIKSLSFPLLFLLFHFFISLHLFPFSPQFRLERKWNQLEKESRIWRRFWKKLR